MTFTGPGLTEGISTCIKNKKHSELAIGKVTQAGIESCDNCRTF